MKIGIVGAGAVGSNLARAFIGAGHEVMLSSREPAGEKMTSLLRALGSSASAGTVAETVAFGQVVVLALRWDAIPDAVIAAGEGAWSGKIVIDATNRFGNPRSAAEELSQIAQGARVVKAFNTIGAENYLNPSFNGEPASMLIAGDDASAKAAVSQLASDIGFEPIDVGDLAAAMHVENLAALWVHLAKTQSRNIGFRLLRR